MRNFLNILVIIIFISVSYYQTQAATVKGKVVDQQTQTALSGANILIKNQSKGTTTDDSGHFEIKNISAGEYQLILSFIGYKTQTRKISLNSEDKKDLTIALSPSVIQVSGISIISSRYEKRMDEMALPIAVVTDEQIQKKSVLTLSDAVESEPGISLGRDGIWGTRMVIRGLSKYNIVTLVDGNRIDTAPDLAAGTSMIDLNDIERVEVIRGAGSSLYGTGAVGGVINVITSAGFYADKFQLSGKISSGFASANNLGFGNLQLSANANHWYLHLSSMYRQAENMKTPDGELPNSQFQDENISAKLGFRPWENHEIKLNYQNFQANDVGIPGGLDLFPGSAVVRYPFEQREMMSGEFISRNLFPFLNQVSIKYFIQNITRDVENIPNTVKTVPGTPTKKVSVLKVTPGAEHEVDGVQVQTNWFLFNRHILIAGMDAWQKEYRGHRSKFQKIEVLNPDGTAVANTIYKEIGELPLPNSQYASLGFFAQDEFSLLHERLNLTLGSRFDRIQIENEEALNPLFEITNGVRNDSPANQTVLWPALSENKYSWSGNLNILYRLTSEFSTTFSASKSFRSPSLEERFAFIDLGSVVKLGDPNLAPEKGTFVDIGFRLEQEKFALNGNVFLNQLTDLVTDMPTLYEERAALITTNIGKARLYGFDGRMDWQIWSQGVFYGTLAYVKGEDTKNNTPLPLIPPLNGQLGLRWSTSLGFNLDASIKMYATQERIAEGEKRTPGYATADIFLNSIPIPLGRLNNQFTLGIENLLNRAYRNHLATNRGLVVAEPGRNISLKWLMSF